MRSVRGWAISVVLCLALVGAVMASQVEGYTVGDFAVNLANMVTNKADFTPEQAAAYLNGVGVELGDLNAQVDEEIFVGAFNRLGVNLVTGNPQAEISSEKASQVFQMFDRNDTLFTGELFKTCQQGDGEPKQCVSDSDCKTGKCKVVNSIKCNGGSEDGTLCTSDGDCPDGSCTIPPGQARKLDVASPIDG